MCFRRLFQEMLHEEIAKVFVPGFHLIVIYYSFPFPDHIPFYMSHTLTLYSSDM